MARGIGPDGPQPSAGGEWLKQGVSRVGGVGHNLPRSPQGPRGVQVLEVRQIAANHLLRSADDTLQIVQGIPIVFQNDSRTRSGCWPGVSR